MVKGTRPAIVAWWQKLVGIGTTIFFHVWKGKTLQDLASWLPNHLAFSKPNICHSKNICHFCTCLSLFYVLRIFEDRCQLGSHSAQCILHITIQFHYSINLSLITAFSQPGCHYMNSCAGDEPWASMRNGGPCCDSFDSWPARRSSWLKKMELSE